MGPVFKLVYSGSEGEEKKSDNILHNIHPEPFDPYVQLCSCTAVNLYSYSDVQLHLHLGPSARLTQYLANSFGGIPA